MEDMYTTKIGCAFGCAGGDLRLSGVLAEKVVDNGCSCALFHEMFVFHVGCNVSVHAVLLWHPVLRSNFTCLMRKRYFQVLYDF